MGFESESPQKVHTQVAYDLIDENSTMILR